MLSTWIEYIDSLRLNVGIVNQNEIERINVYPNPIKSQFSVSFDIINSGNLAIVAQDLLGKNLGIVYQGIIVQGRNNLKLDLAQFGFGSGVYFLNFKLNGKNITSQKVVLQE